MRCCHSFLLSLAKEGISAEFSSEVSYYAFSYLYCFFVDCMQRLIFDEPEDGVRKIVLATNIAETSITINDVVFVLDCGKAKETSYDALNNTPCLLPSWISKVSAQQVRMCCVFWLKVLVS